MKVVIGIGNELRGDDAVGCYIAKRLIEYFNGEGDIFKKDNLCIINARTSLEAYTDIIKELKPKHIIIVDCALINEDYRIIKLDEIDNLLLSSHNLPISFIIKYLKNFIDFDLTIIGIRPRVIDFCDMSNETKKIAEKVLKEIIKMVK
ncbi:hydrogenase maturation protease HycI [Methanocaldococcus villosus KIN24-T80]|uniref:Hydrogenase maturation protease HycI n=1 Tax=Methanocaldococcus villosus KIN24-T80 TaxID=1069083 RepID=N6UVY5_9EURY|nr:hydrogenase maturation peptidase HycI [Methanocaldococcus villosus]ENN96489.1 hydrogenase maturation protease HycI [Methanocaldococcus villosus KIN24-T80]